MDECRDDELGLRLFVAATLIYGLHQALDQFIQVCARGCLDATMRGP